MSILQENGFSRLNIDADEEKKLEYLRLINIAELIEQLKNGNNTQPQLNGDGKPIEKYYCLGSFVAVAKGIFSIMIGRSENPYIYRGQNKDFPEFIPTASRNTEKNIINNCKNWVQKQEFIEFFKTTPYYKRCKTFRVFDCYYDFDLEAVAQHYGFISKYIDITKDMYIAMFFAYTHYDSKEDKYYPIEDFTDLSPTLYVANVIDIYKEFETNFKIIGFQSVLRPRLQHATALDASNLNLKNKFKAISLPREPIIAREIFDQFRGGATIFPKDYIAICSNAIKNSMELKEVYVIEYCNANKLDFIETKKQLQQQGYKLTDIKFRATEYDTYMMNRDLDDWIIPTLNQYIAVYPVLSNLKFTI